MYYIGYNLCQWSFEKHYVGESVQWLVGEKRPPKELGNDLFVVSENGRETPGRKRTKIMTWEK